MAISKKKREKALKLMRTFEETREKGAYITEDYLVYHGFDKGEALQTLTVLEGMGYVKFNTMPGGLEKNIVLTDKGKCYFETKKDDRLEFIKKNIFVPIIVSIITTLATLLITNYISNELNNDTNKTQVEMEK